MASRRLALGAVALYHGTNDGAVVAVAALFPILLTEGLLRNFSDIGLLTLVGLFVTVVFQIVFGAWSDRASPRLLLPAGMVILGAASFLTTQATSFAFLLGVVVLGRIGASVYHPVGIAWVGRRFKDAVDRTMGFQSAGGDFGVIVAFASSAFLALQFGWQVPFLLWGSLALGAAVVGYLMTAEAHEPAKGRPRGSWLAILRRSLLWIVPLAMGGAAYIITVNYGHLLMIQRLGLREDIANLVIAVWIGAGVVTAYNYGRISAWIGRFRSLALAFLLIGLAGLILSLAPPLIVLVPTFLAFGFAAFLTYPALFAYISESAEERMGGATFGVVFGFQLIGGALAGYAAGMMADLWGIHTPFLLLMGLGFATLVLLLLVRTRVGELGAVPQASPDSSA